MLQVKILPEQVARYWDVIKYAIQQALPPIAGESEEKMNNILQAALLDQIQVWAITEDPTLEKIVGIMTTRISEDPMTQTKNLLIYSLYGFKRLGEEAFDAIYEATRAYAKNKGCNRVLAYTDEDNIISIGERYGGRARYTLLTFDI